MNATDLLVQDHEKLKKLLSEITDTTERAVKKRTELLAQIEAELHAHTQIEEEDFYPAYKKAGGKDETKMYHEAKEEHRAVEALVLPDLKKTDVGTVEFSGRIKVLKEMLEHHIEEEESEMFPEAEKILNKQELAELGERMEKKKKMLLAATRH
ncbi:hemerythrin domain-containing protein [Halopseudomonas nanhaiensis]|uniref:hemerythrin domain-containing protein n=1 Tax=Halopseudomonas nanhaiensis TaxID=2830842 RepID=UPI001CC1C1D1|nr:hemerythrin domain-containing protein [Halopseudomonas nanhaiensis]UAW97513.1 hemerythrin domain-containing protein [Halopseudomonas nanhaiensis]